MPVGGVKEKVIAAHRAGIKRIVLSVKNEKDLRDIPDNIKADLKVIPVDWIDEVLDLALESKPDAVGEILAKEDSAAPSDEKTRPSTH